jgi:FdhD protein
MTARTRAGRVLHVDGDAAGWRADRLAVEEPLELRMDGRPLTVTMRTPGDDFDLAVGLLIAEGIVDSARQVRAIRACAQKETGLDNVLDIELTEDAPPFDPGLARRFVTTSACGLCGRTSIDAVRARLHHDVASDPLRVSAEVVASLPRTLRSGQRAFSRTGGLHGAALFDAAGTLLCVREDVGRHNAFDKVIGWAATREMLPLRSHMILASGRASFELTQKALIAGIPLLAAVSAPSSLAVELAEEAGMTLVGFLRGSTMNVYTRPERVNLPGGKARV